jgi:hypothetical protein
MRNTFLLGQMVLMLGSAMVVGCAQTQTAVVSEQFFASPGRYSAAPLSAARPRVGAPAPAVEVVEGAAPDARPRHGRRRSVVLGR